MKAIKSVAVPITRRGRVAIRPSAVAPPPVVADVLEAVPEPVAAEAPKRSAVNPTIAAPQHRFEIGERLRMMNGGRTLARVEAFCTVTSTLPYEGHGALLYRVRSEAEQFERVVAEADLSRKVDEWT